MPGWLFQQAAEGADGTWPWSVLIAAASVPGLNPVERPDLLGFQARFARDAKFGAAGFVH